MIVSAHLLVAAALQLTINTSEGPRGMDGNRDAGSFSALLILAASLFPSTVLVPSG